MDAAVFLDVPQYVPPLPQIMPHRAAAQALQSQLGAQWDPACAAVQPVLLSPPSKAAEQQKHASRLRAQLHAVAVEQCRPAVDVPGFYADHCGK